MVVVAMVVVAEYVYVDGSQAVPVFSQWTSITVHIDLVAQLLLMLSQQSIFVRAQEQ